MYCSWLLLFVSFSVFSDISTAPVQKRGLLSNINIDIKLGKQNTSKNVDTTPTPGTRKTVLNAPFGLGTLTITTNKKNSSNNEASKPCNPDAENITKDNIYKPDVEKDALGGKGSAFLGFGRPPPPPPQYGGFFGPPPPPYNHQHHFGCHHEPPPPPPCESTSKTPPQYTSTEIPQSTLNERTPTIPSTQSTTENVDALIGDIFGGGDTLGSSTSTTRPNPQNIELTDREQTGEGVIDVRMPKRK